MPFKKVKRYQMVFDARKNELPEPTLPDGFFWVPWSDNLLAKHAEVKHKSFRNELDAELFPTFSQYESCLRLMDSIASRSGFVPDATCMIAFGTHTRILDYCANIQGIKVKVDVGAIQNVAVMPGYRRRGLGFALVAKCLRGFKRNGTDQVTLEVTAENGVAVRLYQRLGFVIFNTIYKESFSL